VSTKKSQPPTFPDPDPRLLEPPLSTAPKPGDPTATIHGYIGTSTKDHIHLHHRLDHRAFYQIPKAGVVSCKKVADPKLTNLHELVIYRKTPIRYHEATSVTTTAGAFADAVTSYNAHNLAADQLGTECQPTCPPGCCRNGTCICAPAFPLGGTAGLFGLTPSSPGTKA
jgi:hypothetical protein